MLFDNNFNIIHCAELSTPFILLFSIDIRVFAFVLSYCFCSLMKASHVCTWINLFIYNGHRKITYQIRYTSIKVSQEFQINKNKLYGVFFYGQVSQSILSLIVCILICNGKYEQNKFYSKARFALIYYVCVEFPQNVGFSVTQ